MNINVINIINEVKTPKIEFKKIDEFHLETFFQDRSFRYGYILVDGVRTLDIDKVEDRTYEPNEDEGQPSIETVSYEYYIRTAFNSGVFTFNSFGWSPTKNADEAVETAKKYAADFYRLLMATCGLLNGASAVKSDRLGVTLRAERAPETGVVKVYPDREIWVLEDSKRALDSLQVSYLGLVINDHLLSEIAYKANQKLAEATLRGEVRLEEPNSKTSTIAWTKMVPRKD